MPVGHRTPRGREFGRAGTRGVMLVTVRVSTITSFDDEGGEGSAPRGRDVPESVSCVAVMQSFHYRLFVIIKRAKPQIASHRICKGTRRNRERAFDFVDWTALHSGSWDLHGQG